MWRWTVPGPYTRHGRVLTGDADSALAYGFGKSTEADLREIMALQLDPYLAPRSGPIPFPSRPCRPGWAWRQGIRPRMPWRRWPPAAGPRPRPIRPPRSRAGLGRGVAGPPYVAEPLRAHDCAPVSDGAAVVIIASAARARELSSRPPGSAGSRTGSTRARWARGTCCRCHRRREPRRPRGRFRWAPVDVAELHAPFTHQEILLREAMGLGDDVAVSPSGGALCGNPMFAAGLARIGLAARAVMSGRAGRALGHATSGPALQQNLVCVLDGETASSEAAGGGAGGRADPAPVQAHRRVDGRAVPGGGGPRGRGRRALAGRHRRGGGGQGPGPVRGRDDARAVPGRRARRGRQAAAAGAHGRLGGRRDRERRGQPGAGGVHRRVLALAWEKQSESNAMWALSIAPPFSIPVVAGAGGYFAPHIRAYIRRSGAPSHIGALVAVKDRRNGALNPYAHLQQGDITLEKVQASPMLWDPVRYDETCPSSDGACAVVIGDRGRGGGPGAGRVDPGHLDAQRADHVRGQGPRQPGRGPGLRGGAVAAGRDHRPDQPDRRGRDLRPVLLVRADVAGEPRLRRGRARAGG